MPDGGLRDVHTRTIYCASLHPLGCSSPPESRLKALVTGGAGFIGSHLVRALVARSDDVVVLDDFSSGVLDRLDDLRPMVHVVEGDLRDLGTTGLAMAGRDTVFHLGAVPSIHRSFEDPERTVSVNVGGTVSVMLEAAKAGVRRVVLASSSSVYGAIPPARRREDQRTEAGSPYAASKLAAESIVHSLGARHGIETVALRYFNVFGEGQNTRSEYAAAVPRFVTALLEGTPPIVYGDGTATRDFTHVDNVVSANLLAAQHGAPSGVTCNVACGAEISVRELLAALAEELASDIEAQYVAPRRGEVARAFADISLARSLFGYGVVVPFREGLTRTVASYVEAFEGRLQLDGVA
jgi:UDP-N-acetylglucosamine/UDP-N-acetyl-alpha-D-glucosaminouronate 4-epimerase